MESAEHVSGLIIEGYEAFVVELAERDFQEDVSRKVAFEAVGVEADELADADTGAAHEEEGFPPRGVIGEESFLKFKIDMRRKGSWEIGGDFGDVGCTEEEIRVGVKFTLLEEPLEVGAQKEDAGATGAGGESAVGEGLDPFFSGAAVEIFNVDALGFKPPLEISQTVEIVFATFGFEQGTQGVDEIMRKYRKAACFFAFRFEVKIQESLLMKPKEIWSDSPAQPPP